MYDFGNLGHRHLYDSKTRAVKFRLRLSLVRWITLFLLLGYIAHPLHSPQVHQNTHIVSEYMKPCGVQLQVNKTCPRLLIGNPTIGAGLGHRITEMFFFAQLSRLHQATLILTPFDNSKSHHKDTHLFAIDLLGLRGLFLNQKIDQTLMSKQGFNNYMSVECDTRLTGDYLACPGGDCFKSPLMRNVFQKFMPCTRQISRVYGKWSHLKPYKQYRDVDINVFWHIRVGDVMPYKPEDEFYHKIYSSLEKLLSTVVRAGRVRYYIAADWKQISNAQHVEFVKLFRSLLRKEKFQIVDVSLKDILVFMLHADILIGTGSSLSGIVPLFSERPIYVNIVPKHGWHFQAESFPDSLDTVASGEIVTPVKEFQRLYGLRSRYRNNVAM